MEFFLFLLTLISSNDFENILTIKCKWLKCKPCWSQHETAKYRFRFLGRKIFSWEKQRSIDSISATEAQKQG